MRRTRPFARRKVAAFLTLLVSACAPQASDPGSAAAHEAGGAIAPAAAEAGAGQNPTGGVNAEQWHEADHLVLVSLDGFRADYLDRLKPPTLLALARQGLRAEAAIPPFPTKTFPSHYTIATGLWPEHHGIVGNVFHDPERDADYSSRDRGAVEDGSWYRGEPIWVTAERQGMVAASFFFVGSEADVGGVRPSYWHAYDGAIKGAARVDQALAWLAMPTERRPRMVTLYFSDLDDAGHRFGPGSPQVAEALSRVDDLLARLLAGIDALPHGARVNVLITSDHGMAPWSPSDAHVVDLQGLDDVRMITGGPYANFYVDGADPQRRRQILAMLRARMPDRVDLFPREAMPEGFHYAADPRIGDLVAVAPLGEMIFPAGRVPERGGATHGWAPTNVEMHGIFIARGPRIRPGSRIGAVRSVDIYPLMTELLGLTAAINDGDVAVFSDALVERH